MIFIFICMERTSLHNLVLRLKKEILSSTSFLVLTRFLLKKPLFNIEGRMYYLLELGARYFY